MYLKHQLQPLGVLFFINCNYDVNDHTISSQFYRELLLGLGIPPWEIF